jgi:hypothetical protein
MLWLKAPPAYQPSPSLPSKGYQSGVCPSDSPSAMPTADWCYKISQLDMHNTRTSVLTANKTVLPHEPISVEDAFIVAQKKN